MSRRAPSVFAIVLLAARTAAAEGRPFRLSYAASEGCPAREAMTSRIVASSARAREADPIEPAVELGVHIAAQSGGYMGYLRVRTREGNETTRAVPAATCEETVSALSLIAAIVVDPDAALPAADTPNATADAAPEGATLASPRAPAAPVAAERSPAPIVVADRVERPRKAPRYWIVATGEAGAEGAVAPDPVPDFAVGVGVVDTGRAPLAPSVRLSGRWAKSADIVSTDGTVSFERFAARLSGCPLRWNLGPLAMRPCTFVELGSLHASSTRAVAANSPSVFWGAFGVTGRGEVLLLDRLGLGLDLGALFPFSHDQFYYLPTHNVAYRVETVGFVGSFELAVRFL